MRTSHLPTSAGRFEVGKVVEYPGVDFSQCESLLWGVVNSVRNQGGIGIVRLSGKTHFEGELWVKYVWSEDFGGLFESRGCLR
jgi:hypothetical protein